MPDEPEHRDGNRQQGASFCSKPDSTSGYARRAGASRRQPATRYIVLFKTGFDVGLCPTSRSIATATGNKAHRSVQNRIRRRAMPDEPEHRDGNRQQGA